MATLALVQHNLMCLSLVKNVISHKSITIQRNTGSISVNIGNLKPGKYGLRVEGIIDPKDDGSRFDIDVRTFSTPDMITRTRYKEKLNTHAVAVDLKVAFGTEPKNYFFCTDIDHVPNKGIALFIFRRRGEGHVDPQIVDNILYWDKIKVPNRSW